MLKQAHSPPAGLRPRILLVDDHEDTRRLLRLALELEGYSVEDVSTAEDGLRALEHAGFDLLLSDFCLPGQSGAWLLSQAIGKGLIRSGKVLVLTAHPQPEGVDGFDLLRKPFELDQLFRHVHELLSSPAAVNQAGTLDTVVSESPRIPVALCLTSQPGPPGCAVAPGAPTSRPADAAPATPAQLTNASAGHEDLV